MEKYTSLKNYVLKEFNTKKLKSIAEDNLDSLLGGGEVDPVALFDRFSEEAWKLLYFSSQENKITIGKYLYDMPPNEHEIETIQGFKKLIVWHAIQKIAKIETLAQCA